MLQYLKTGATPGKGRACATFSSSSATRTSQPPPRTWNQSSPSNSSRWLDRGPAGTRASDGRPEGARLPEALPPSSLSAARARRHSSRLACRHPMGARPTPMPLLLATGLLGLAFRQRPLRRAQQGLARRSMEWTTSPRSGRELGWAELQSALRLPASVTEHSATAPKCWGGHRDRFFQDSVASGAVSVTTTNRGYFHPNTYCGRRSRKLASVRHSAQYIRATEFPFGEPI